MSAERFRREILLVAKRQHPHIVPILSAGDAEGALFYVMTFVRGDSLRARIAHEGRLPVRDPVQILREVLGALSTAHEFGAVRRDIKPEASRATHRRTWRQNRSRQTRAYRATR